MFDRVTLDFANGSAEIILEGVHHVFTSTSKFIDLTQFPFNDVVIVSYEPLRNIIIVERTNGRYEDASSPVIQWVEANISNMINAAKEDGWGNIPAGPSLRDVRNFKLFDTDWMVLRHRDELDRGASTTLSSEQYGSLLNYRQALRDITLQYNDVESVVWPILNL